MVIRAELLLAQSKAETEINVQNQDHKTEWLQTGAMLWKEQHPGQWCEHSLTQGATHYKIRSIASSSKSYKQAGQQLGCGPEAVHWIVHLRHEAGLGFM